MTVEKFEGARWLSRTVAMEAPRRFAFTWVHDEDYWRNPPQGPSTLVEFFLEPIEGGTRLTVVESGFEALPPERRMSVLRDNEGGWAYQLQNVRDHVER